MKTYHILNGDVLKEKLQSANIQGELIVCRECLIEGETMSDSLDGFWDLRSKFINRTYNVDIKDYYDQNVSEFQKLLTISDFTEINLWFENDLFCQVNMWFILSLISKMKSHFNVYRIFPVIKNRNDIWKGFGISDEEMLKEALTKRVKFESPDMEIGNGLWRLYSSNDLRSLEVLSGTNSNCFQHLDEVCRAHIERISFDGKYARPEKVLIDIMNTGTNDFIQVFREFNDREGIYGFGDLQVKNIYDKLIESEKE